MIARFRLITRTYFNISMKHILNWLDHTLLHLSIRYEINLTSFLQIHGYPMQITLESISYEIFRQYFLD